MKTITILFSILSLVCCLSSCKKGGGGGDEAPALQVSPEMKAFMGDFKGKSTDVAAALKKHGKEGLDAKDMDMYDLSQPTCVKADNAGGKACYTMEAKAGMTVRTYGVCWDGGKIAGVEDKGMR